MDWSHLIDAPLPNLLFLAGLGFLAVGVFGKIGGKIEPDRVGRITSGVIGIALLIGGLSWHRSTDQASEKQSNAADQEVKTLTNAQNGRCLDADLANSGSNGTRIRLWDCRNSQNQQWKISPDGTIINVRSGRCLDADLGTIAKNGTTVQLYDCWGGQNQRWKMNPDGTIINVRSSRCLDADLGTIAKNGTTVQLYDCWGGQNQEWSARP